MLRENMIPSDLQFYKVVCTYTDGTCCPVKSIEAVPYAEVKDKEIEMRMRTDSVGFEGYLMFKSVPDESDIRYDCETIAAVVQEDWFDDVDYESLENKDVTIFVAFKEPLSDIFIQKGAEGALEIDTVF